MQTIKLILIPTILALLAHYIFQHYQSLSTNKNELKQYRTLWLFLTVFSILAPGVWIFFLGVLIMGNRMMKQFDETGRICLYIIACFTVPKIWQYMPGVGPINKLVKIDITIVAGLVFLAPIFKSSMRSAGLFRMSTDKFILGYFLLMFFLNMRTNTATDAMRHLINQTLAIMLPYFVISRNLKTLRDHHRVIGAILFAFSIMAFISIFEAVLKSFVYTVLKFKYRLISPRAARGAMRAGFMRAQGITGSPITLGILMTCLLGIVLYLAPKLKDDFKKKLSVPIVSAALLFTFARGSWAGGILLAGLMTLKNKGSMKKFFKTFAIVFGLIMVLSQTVFISNLQELIPALGEEEPEKNDTFDYRNRLLDASIIVVKQSPLFGNPRYILHPEMQAMMQGQGIIDIVNSYLNIALPYGLVTLFLFLMCFLPNMYSCYRRAGKLPDKFDDIRRYNYMIVFTMASLMLMIYNMSMINYVPTVLWLYVAMLTALSSMMKNSPTRSDADPDDYPHLIDNYDPNADPEGEDADAKSTNTDESTPKTKVKDPSKW